jgi:4,5-dihydroxyphthalate decarboxylase
MTANFTLAFSPSDRTRPLIDGRVRIESYPTDVFALDHEDMFVRALTKAEFDAVELSYCRYTIDVAKGMSVYTALPVFPSRMFRHSAIYIRADRDIASPADLRGKVFGVRNYANTASLVARGMLEDEYGVKAHEMIWRVGDIDRRERTRIDVPPLPAHYDVRPVTDGRLLSDMLAAGEIDGLFDYQPPRCFIENHPQIARLFPDYLTMERDYFRRTGIFPIMHVLAIKRKLAEEHPDFVRVLYDAFVEAKRLAIADLYSPGALAITLPWVTEAYADTVALMGNDFWPYGIEGNRAAISAVPRYVHAQGLATRQMTSDELFVPQTLFGRR